MSYRQCYTCRHYTTCGKNPPVTAAVSPCPKRDPVLVVSPIPDLPNGYSTLLDRSTANGILRVTHELDLSFKMTDGHLEFLNCWELGCGGDWTWEPNEVNDFEADHPGLLKEIETAINAGAIRYT